MTRKVYEQEDLARCKVCSTYATVLIARNVGGVRAMFSYCTFHGEIAAQYFGYSESRIEIKGGIQVAPNQDVCS